MEIVQWEEHYSIGHPLLDSHHQQFLAIMNKMAANANIRVDSEMMSEILTCLREFEEYHFKAEESYMQQIEFAELPEHKQHHRQFRINIGKFCLDAIEHDPTVPDRLRDYLSQWWIEHILQQDMALKTITASY